MTVSAPKIINSYNQKQEYLQIRAARTCYSHLAGQFGVNLFEYFLDCGLLEKGNHEIFLTKKGNVFFKDLGLIQIDRLSGKLCMDWSERKFHLAGGLGKAICTLFLEKDWIKKSEKNRSIELTVNCPEWLKQI